MSRVFLEELNRQQERLSNGALDCVQTFFQQEPGVNNMLRWMDQRNLRELQIAQLMSSAFTQMGPEIPRDIFVAIGKFIHDEVRHFRDFTRTIEKLRAEYPESGGACSQLPEEKNWRRSWRSCRWSIFVMVSIPCSNRLLVEYFIQVHQLVANHGPAGQFRNVQFHAGL